MNISLSRSSLRIWSRGVRPSRPASFCSFSTRRLDLVIHGLSPDFRGGVHLFIYTAIRHRVT